MLRIHPLPLATGLLLVVACSPAFAAVSSHTLLPDTTTGYISIGDVHQLSSSWKKTQLGQLMQDGVMKPFSDDLKRQFRSKWSRVTEKLALTLDDLKGVPSGELSVAAIRPAADRSAVVVLADVTDSMDKAEALLAKVDGNLLKKGASKQVAEVLGTSVTTYTLPPREGRTRPRTAVFFINDNVLCGTDDAEVARGILVRFSGEPTDNLKNLESYRTIMERVSASQPELVPELRWFVDPFGYAQTVRNAVTEGKGKKKGKDFVNILSSQGFDAVRGAGGLVNFYVEGRYEVLHRTMVYAPPVEGHADGDRYNLAARILRFPNGANLEPQPWVPRELATYLTFNWKIREAFEYVGTLVDEVVGEEGVFEDVIESVEKDPNGPQINLRSDLVAYLGERATLITDYQLPITPKSERMVLAIEATDPAKLAVTIAKTMETDPDAHRREFGEYVIWEIVDEEDDLPELDIQGLNSLDPIGGDAPADAEEEKRMLPNSAVCVGNGHLLVATHIDLLKKVLSQDAEDRPQLAQSTDFRLVADELTKLVPGDRCLRYFSRMDEEFRPTYELLRTGRMPESESVLGQILNAAFADRDSEELRMQKIDGSEMPNYEMVRRYLGPAGMVVEAEENGWFLLGVSISKETP